MLTLYHANHSTCSQKVRLCLAEKGLEYESKLVNLATKEQLAPEYLAMNPNGVVPTLVHDGRPILDSGVICEYIDEVFPDNPLMPKDPVERAQVRAWICYIDEVPVSAIRVPSFNMAFLPRYDGLDDETFQNEQADVRPLRKHFYEKMGRKGFDDTEVDNAMEQLATSIARMERDLAHQPWLSGRDFGLADIIAAPFMDRLDDLGFEDMWEAKSPQVADWFKRLSSRPAYAEAFYPKSRLTEFLPIGPLHREKAPV
ncbi:glutathione S-transferase family protein [Octadecabacter sp. 1_MG-2023]|uniref:glutathione S-transferase family protein n=1 Tax=unclassified Octadecabacter TaxID=196158 RepID=UPI001C09F665|nr:MULTISPECIES: glutathione S-transferase family protein [unclassified Octadecabacter]MBU2993367.1 glutathione S-transferase family protein [Octadecabacter sp. B2R22]MDO6733177.1 glutathione S-transferase family protein [Octadecabacter sp. 1_MG-2023]